VRDKKKKIFGYKRFLFPLIKLVCSSFMSSSVLHKIAVREEVVPVPFRHTIQVLGLLENLSVDGSVRIKKQIS
jgi:hypothetical protein